MYITQFHKSKKSIKMSRKEEILNKKLLKLYIQYTLYKLQIYKLNNNKK